TVEGYRSFLAQHPHGKWSEEARIRIEGFSLGSAPRTERQTQPKVAANRAGVNALLLATGVAAKTDAGAPPPAVPAAASDAIAPPVVAAAADTSVAPLGAAAAAGETVGQTRVYAAVDPSDLAQPAPASEETHAHRARDPAGGYGVQLGAFATAASAD